MQIILVLPMRFCLCNLPASIIKGVDLVTMNKSIKFKRWLLTPLVVGVVTMGFSAEAGIVLSNLGDAKNGTAQNNVNQYKAESFTIAGASTINVQIILGLNFQNGATLANVYLANASSTNFKPIPTSVSAFTLIGTVSSGSSLGTSSGGANEYSVNLNSQLSLTEGQNYAIILDTVGNGSAVGSVGWQYSNSSHTGFLGAFNLGNQATPTWGQPQATEVRYMQINAVPEPITQAMMIFVPVVFLISVGRQLVKNQKTAI